MGAVHNAIENLLNEHDVARIIGLSVASVRRWRVLRQGPKYIKIGQAVRYRRRDVAAWIENSSAHEPGSNNCAETRRERVDVVLEFLVRVLGILVSIGAHFWR
jgi:predicted DNA-binding transcriptional regulator AlpA